MKDSSYSTHDSGEREVTYGADRFGSWLALREKLDNWLIVGNCATNRERIRNLIQARGIRIPERHLGLFSEPMMLAA